MTLAMITLIWMTLCLFRCLESTGDLFTVDEKVLIFLNGIDRPRKNEEFQLNRAQFKDKDSKTFIRYNSIRKVVPDVCRKTNEDEYEQGPNLSIMHHPNLEHLLRNKRIDFDVVKRSCGWLESLTIGFLVDFAMRHQGQLPNMDMPGDKARGEYDGRTVTYLQVQWMVATVCGKANSGRYGESVAIHLVKQSCQFLYDKVFNWLMEIAMIGHGTGVSLPEAAPYVHNICSNIGNGQHNQILDTLAKQNRMRQVCQDLRNRVTQDMSLS